MNREQIKETLGKQLQLLSERSTLAQGDLGILTAAMVNVAALLLQFEPPQP